MRAIYVCDTGTTPVAVAANTTKTVLAIKGDTGHGIDLLGFAFSLDQATPTAGEKAVMVELCACTFAGAGTSSSSTIDSYAGPRVAETFTASEDYTAEPTALTVLEPIDCDPYKFTYKYDYPLGESPDSPAGEGFVLRVVNPSANTVSVNVRAWFKWARV